MAQTTLRGRFTNYLMMLLVVTGMLAVPIIAADRAGAGPAVSDFDAGDGNQIEDADETDWETLLPDTDEDNLTFKEDTPSGMSDSSLAGGTKAETECPTPSTGSVPDVKSDLKHFALAWESIFDEDQNRNELFLYMEFVRGQPSGNTASASAIFELNQSDEACPDVGKGNRTSPSPFVVRTDGDLRISVNDEGGSEPLLKAQVWDEPCGTNNPGDLSGCWLPEVALSTQDSDASFNAVTTPDLLLQDANGVTPPNPATAPQLQPQQFFEASVNATDAGLVASECLPFSAVWLQTGASGNSDKEQSKDIIEPELIALDTCEPSTDISVSVDDDTIFGDQEVTLTISETNDGNVALAEPTGGYVTTDETTCVPADVDEVDNEDATENPDGLNDGDTNGDGILDAGETWTFTCSFTPSTTTTVTVFGHGLFDDGVNPVVDVTWVDECAGDDGVIGPNPDNDDVNDDPESVDTDNDEVDDVLCDADELDSVTITRLAPGTTLKKFADAVITYTYTETNDGDVGLEAPNDETILPSEYTDSEGDPVDSTDHNGGWVVDDQCSPVLHVLGDGTTTDADADHNIGDVGDPSVADDPATTDVNEDPLENNNLLDPLETWVFTCEYILAGPRDTSGDPADTGESSVSNVAIGSGRIPSSVDSNNPEVTYCDDPETDQSDTKRCSQNERDEATVTIEHGDAEPDTTEET